ncbi:hypothetical protein PQ783_001198 [Klebsiella pneumoniae]|nr:hypothetical protein [Klebsiella pneumoniae]
MTDITELAQSLKTAAEKAADNFDPNMFVQTRDILALVEALEKAQHTITEMDNRIRQQNRNVCELFDDNTVLRQRIAELEESHAQVIQSRDHYKRITEEGLRRLAESRTVKLPALPRLGANTEWYQGFAAGAESMRSDCAHAINAAGIKVEAE